VWKNQSPKSEKKKKKKGTPKAPFLTTRVKRTNIKRNAKPRKKFFWRTRKSLRENKIKGGGVGSAPGGQKIRKREIMESIRICVRMRGQRRKKEGKDGGFFLGASKTGKKGGGSGSDSKTKGKTLLYEEDQSTACFGARRSSQIHPVIMQGGEVLTEGTKGTHVRGN